MSRLRLLCTAAVLTLAANANASSLIMTTDSIVGALKATSDATSDATSSCATTRSYKRPVTTPPALSPAKAPSVA